ncbi:MBL fold metallo-hydrolase [Sinomonas sp. JGH33]|uniref:MBL fold metallo-hydrolase n=1 Tax=Sinomonas terricola TaxID=3110330 RepID=A0ABU5T923_9MICC|nr:MBL fold metallo-hydrolase [Sinomonas sp. JGH33]MEA5455601.1 MBL fold metallo-hydrolase [Sinomonas sp. JGH33]
MNASNPRLGPHVVALGTAGGPRWWNSPGGSQRSGISTAVVIQERVYLVDCGQGTGRQLKNAGLGMDQVRGLFITHLHSDHTVDLASMILFGQFERKNPALEPIRVFGPGPRGKLPPLSTRAESVPDVVAPANPGPGIEELFDLLSAAYATDINDRIFDSLTRPPSTHFDVHDIVLPEGTGFDPNDNVCPDMEPFTIFEDDLVEVTAILVSHHPTAPAFAFRFDSAEGSVTISGDTAPCRNLVRLAQSTDLLMHEAIDLEIIAAQYTDQALMKATMDHHRRAHTTARQAGDLATQAGARSLALHHLVPASAPAESWLTARETFAGQIFVPDDLEAISFAAAPRTTSDTAVEPAKAIS